MLFQMLSLFYIDFEGFKYENLVHLLENKKVQEKVINTLFMMYRDPFGTDIFRKQRYNMLKGK